MATETLINVGIRRNFVGLGDRNFEDSGTVQYKASRAGTYNGVAYDIGDAIPFDVDGTHYSVAIIELLRFFWNQGWIAPIA